MYSTTHDVKVKIFISDLSRSNIIPQHIHFDDSVVDQWMVYVVIKGSGIMVHLGLISKF